MKTKDRVKVAVRKTILIESDFIFHQYSKIKSMDWFARETVNTYRWRIVANKF